jgi:hypothetical protein
MLLRWEFLLQAILILSPISAQELPSTASKIALKSLWGSNKNALIQGITADEIASTGVATQNYVIVGAGPGGLTLAMRLTEDPNVRVAIIEKGTLIENDSLTFEFGNLATSTFVDPTNPALLPSLDYIDITSPIKANGYSQHYPQGKMIGGSSARGFSAYAYQILLLSNSTYANSFPGYSRATKGTMQKWADTVGDADYTWDKMFRISRSPRPSHPQM